MKILMMTNSYFPTVGGLEQSIYSFSEEYKRKGHEVLIITPSFTDAPAGEDSGILCASRMSKFNELFRAVNPPDPRILTRALKRFSPDIVHAHHPFLMGDLAFCISRERNIPIVFTYHIMFEDYLHCWPVQSQTMRRAIIRLAAGYANMSDQVIAPSQNVRDILLKRGVTSAIEVVPTGIELEQFSKSGAGAAFRKRNHIPIDATVIGHVGRLAPEKNLEFLLSCIVELLKSEPKAHALIVGSGPSEKILKDAFDSSGVGGRLHLIGIVDHKDIGDAYSAMDIFAFASLSETQGIVLFEAMASGVPIIALDAPVVHEIIEDRQNGRLVSKADRQGFLEALQWILSLSPGQLQELKNRAKDTVQKYSMNQTAEQMLGIYGHLRTKEPFSSGPRDVSWPRSVGAGWRLLKNQIEAFGTSISIGGLREDKKIETIIFLLYAIIGSFVKMTYTIFSRIFISLIAVVVPAILLRNGIYGSFLFTFSIPIIWQIGFLGRALSSLGLDRNNFKFSVIAGIVTGCMAGFAGGVLLKAIGISGNLFTSLDKVQFSLWHFTAVFPLQKEFLHRLLVSSDSPINLLIYFIASLFLIGLGEELFWRGFIQKKLSVYLQKDISIWATALIFALSHFYLLAIIPFRPWVLFLTLIFAAGALWGYLFKYFNNLWACAISHGIAAFIIWKYFFFAH